MGTNPSKQIAFEAAYKRHAFHEVARMGGVGVDSNKSPFRELVGIQMR